MIWIVFRFICVIWMIFHLSIYHALSVVCRPRLWIMLHFIECIQRVSYTISILLFVACIFAMYNSFFWNFTSFMSGSCFCFFPSSSSSLSSINFCYSRYFSLFVAALLWQSSSQFQIELFIFEYTQRKVKKNELLFVCMSLMRSICLKKKVYLFDVIYYSIGRVGFNSI